MNKIEKAVKEYQCSGCIKGPFETCFAKSQYDGVGCDNHVAATYITPNMGQIFLGMPNGFNRLGQNSKTKILIFEKFENFVNPNGYVGYSKFMVPTWKYLNENGHTLVRVYMPRINNSCIHVFLENTLDKINCIEITKEDIENMD